ncbi:MAG TPA: energy transducer TonB [Opitutaceae bacterium]|nr:energy transducer TonB [Opitutaceae bacterium]
MKPSISLLAFALLVLPASAQMPNAASGLQPLRVIESDLPVFPHELMQLGVREGEVRVAFSVDTNGRIDDCLAVLYTRREFAEVSLAALKRWRFEPARFRGEPIAAASEVTIKFEIQGTVVVSMTPSETISARIFSMLDDHDGLRPCTLKELDHIPVPIAAQTPVFPANLAHRNGVRQVTVGFYIDETGAVRLPSVDVNDDPELGAIAINAIRNWKFEPPTCKGRPVLVRASQLFNFHPAPKTAVAAGTQ